jgi:hypothetical protein
MFFGKWFPLKSIVTVERSLSNSKARTCRARQSNQPQKLCNRTLYVGQDGAAAPIRVAQSGGRIGPSLDQDRSNNWFSGCRRGRGDTLEPYLRAGLRHGRHLGFRSFPDLWFCHWRCDARAVGKGDVAGSVREIGACSNEPVIPFPLLAVPRQSRHRSQGLRLRSKRRIGAATSLAARPPEPPALAAWFPLGD